MAQSGDLKLAYWERAPPLAAIAAARLAGIPLESKADPKLNKDSPPVLTLPTRLVLALRPVMVEADHTVSFQTPCR